MVFVFVKCLNADQFLLFLSIFIPVLSRSYFTSKTLDKDEKIEQLFYFLLIQVP